jgi:predicted permease
LNSIVAVLTQNILPFFLVVALGYGLQRWRGLDKRTLSSLVMNVLSPCLVFSALVTSRLPGEELLGLGAFTLISVALMGFLSFGLARLAKFSRSQTVAMMISVMFVNGGNYGLTLNQLRYGEAGLARAIVYYTTSTLIVFTAGIFIASMGQLKWREALSKLFRLPPVYAAMAAVVVYSLNITVPAPLMAGIDVAAAGAIPVMIIVLGMQMADLDGLSELRLAIPAVFLRMIVGPLIGLLTVTLISLRGLGRSTSIIESSMPTAVFAIVLATEFDLQPKIVTSIVLLSTLLSPLTVAATITLLGL